jgi:hypothetical protein
MKRALPRTNSEGPRPPSWDELTAIGELAAPAVHSVPSKRLNGSDETLGTSQPASGEGIVFDRSAAT